MSDTPCLIDLQLDLPTLPAELAPPQPLLALELLLPVLAADLAPPAPLLDLVPRLPEAIDAALIPILMGPPGGGADLVNPVLTWSAGRLVGVAYDGGASKSLAYSGDQLATLDMLRPGQPTLRKTFSYNPDGTLAAVTQAEV